MARRDVANLGRLRLLEVGKRGVENLQALGPLRVLAGGMQAPEVGMADELYQAGFCTTCCAIAPLIKTLAPLTYPDSSPAR